MSESDPVEEYNNSDTRLSWTEFQLSKLSKDTREKVLKISSDLKELHKEYQGYDNEISLISRKKDILFNKIKLLNEMYEDNILPDCSVCGIPSYSKYCGDCY